MEDQTKGLEEKAEEFLSSIPTLPHIYHTNSAKKLLVDFATDMLNNYTPIIEIRLPSETNQRDLGAMIEAFKKVENNHGYIVVFSLHYNIDPQINIHSVTKINIKEYESIRRRYQEVIDEQII